MNGERWIFLESYRHRLRRFQFDQNQGCSSSGQFRLYERSLAIVGYAGSIPASPIAERFGSAALFVHHHQQQNPITP